MAQSGFKGFGIRQLGARTKKALQGVKDASPLTRKFARRLKTASDRAFREESNPETGNPWAELRDLTLAFRELNGYGFGPKLVNEGRLKSSINVSFSKKEARIVADAPYAELHMKGGRNEQGFYVPARPFLGISQRDWDAMQRAAQEYAKDLLTGGMSVD